MLGLLADERMYESIIQQAGRQAGRHTAGRVEGRQRSKQAQQPWVTLVVGNRGEPDQPRHRRELSESDVSGDSSFLEILLQHDETDRIEAADRQNLWNHGLASYSLTSPT